MQQSIRDQPRERIGAALHDRFEAMHADGHLITAEQSARSLLDRIAGRNPARSGASMTARTNTCPASRRRPPDQEPHTLKERTDHAVAQPRRPLPVDHDHPSRRSAIDLPDILHGHFAVILFYRGSWCPYCNAQLRAFQHATETLDALDVKVVALSVDDEATTHELIAKHGLTFPVGYSADAAATTRRPECLSTPTRFTCSRLDSSLTPRQSDRQRLLQRRDRPPGTRRRRRPGQLPRPNSPHDDGPARRAP